MIKPPRATEPWIDFFSVYRDQKPPKTAQNQPEPTIHEKQMIFMTKKKQSPIQWIGLFCDRKRFKQLKS